MPISAEFQADFSQFTAAVKEATSGLATMEGQAKQMDLQIADLGLKAGQAIGQVAKDITAAASSFMASYAEEEAATQRLVTALQAQGTATDAVIGDFAAMATQFQNTTKYSDDMVTSAQALFTTIGRVGPQDMQAAMTAATNLATVLGIDLESATRMLAKAVATGGESLGKMGPLLADVNVKGMSASEMFAVISEKTGPAAADQLNTVAGQTQYLANQMDDAKGKIGGMIASALMPLVQVFTTLPQPLQAVTAGTVALGLAIAPIAVSIGALTPAITALATAMGVTLVGALTTLGSLLLPGAILIAGITAVYLAFKNWDSIVGICQAVYNGIKRWMVDAFVQIKDRVVGEINAIIGAFKSMYQAVVGGSYVPDMMNGIRANFANLQSYMVGPVETATARATAAFAELASQRQASLRAMHEAGGTDPITAAYRAAGIMVNTSGGAGGLRPVTVNVQGNVLGTQEELARLIGNALAGNYRAGGNRYPI